MSEPPPQDLRGASADDLRAKVFRDREHSGDWRVEKMNDEGGIELALFSGGDARQRAISTPTGNMASSRKSNCMHTTAHRL
jgi:hypothetical protein